MKFNIIKSHKLAMIIALCTVITVGCNEESKEAKKEEPKQTEKTVTTETKMPPMGQPAGHPTGQPQEDVFEKLPEVVATVNGQDILKKDLQKIHTMLQTQAARSNRQVAPDEVMDIALKELINMQVLKQESERQKIVPSADDVKQEMDKIKTNFPDEDTFKKTITEKGLTVEEIEKSITSQLAVQQIIKKELEDKISIPNSEIEKFYNENPNYFKSEESVKAAHILIKVDNKAEEAAISEAKKKIEGILASVKGGADFAETAKKSSEGPSGPGGGDLGFFTKGKMVKPFEDAAFALKVGEVSDVVRSPFGFHIIKVTDKKEAGVTPLKEVEEKIKSFLSKTQGEKLFNTYVEKLRTTAKIEKKF